MSNPVPRWLCPGCNQVVTGAACPRCEPDEAVMVEENLPKQIGEVIGWRVWRVLELKQGYRLASLGAGGVNATVIWLPGESLEATCTKGATPHLPPQENCTCGFYSASSREHLISLNAYHREGQYDLDSVCKVIGEVKLWGKVIPGTQGWRAQKVTPMSLHVPFNHQNVAKGLKKDYGAHGIKVRLDNLYKSE